MVLGSSPVAVTSNYWIFVMKIVPSCSLETSNSSNRLNSNEISLKLCFGKDFLNIWNRDSPKSFLFWFYYRKKRFSHNFLLVASKTIINLRIKMSYKNRGNTFLLYYLIFAWIKIHANIIRFTWSSTWSSLTVRMFLQKRSN